MLTKEEWLEESRHFWCGCLGYDFEQDERSTETWFAMMEDTAEMCLKDCAKVIGEPAPEGLDGNDVVHFYLQNRERILDELRKPTVRKPGESVSG